MNNLQTYLQEVINKTEGTAKLAKLQLLKDHLQFGDLVTLTGCGGSIREFYLTGIDGNWLCGEATETTKLFEWYPYSNDLYPTNITHVNRCEVSSLEYISERCLESVRGVLAKRDQPVKEVFKEERTSLQMDMLENVNAAVGDYIYGKMFPEFAEENGGLESLYKQMYNFHTAYEREFNTLGDDEI